jgi:hypothetical protein
LSHRSPISRGDYPDSSSSSAHAREDKQEKAPYPCDGDLPRIYGEFVEIFISHAATNGTDKANFTIQYNAGML